jgi:hypothetical protein
LLVLAGPTSKTSYVDVKLGAALLYEVQHEATARITGVVASTC